MIALSNLAGLYDCTGHTLSALGCLKEAIKLAEKQKDISSQNRSHLLAGDIYTNLGLIDKSIEHYSFALDAARESGEPAPIANSLSALAYIYSSEYDNPNKAQPFVEEALELARIADDPDSEATALRVLGVVYKHKGDNETSKNYLQKALSIADRAKNHGIILNLHMQLGSIELLADRGEKALKHFETARNLAFEIGNMDLKGRALLSIASTYLRLGNGAQAYEILVEAVNLMEAYRESLDDEKLSLRLRKFLLDTYSMLMLFFHRNI